MGFILDLRAREGALGELDRERLDDVVARLERKTSPYERRRLHVDVQPTRNACEVRMVLSVAKRRGVVCETAPAAGVAFQRCADSLERWVEHVFKERTHSGHGERLRRRIGKEEAALPDLRSAREARARGDYEGFVDALGLDVEEAVACAVARQLKFHPDADALLDEAFSLPDIYDRVLRRAWESFAVWPVNVTFREWLIGQVDPAIEDVARAA
jgi:hypothetical protein